MENTSVRNVIQCSNINTTCIGTLENTQRRHWNVINVITLAQHSILKNIGGNTTKSLKKYAHYAKRVSTLEWNYGAINNIATGAIAPNIKTKWINRTIQPTRLNCYLEVLRHNYKKTPNIDRT